MNYREDNGIPKYELLIFEPKEEYDIFYARQIECDGISSAGYCKLIMSLRTSYFYIVSLASTDEKSLRITGIKEWKSANLANSQYIAATFQKLATQSQIEVYFATNSKDIFEDSEDVVTILGSSRDDDCNSSLGLVDVDDIGNHDIKF